MEILSKITNEIPELKDQEKLLEECLKENSALSKGHIKIIAWTSSIVSKDEKIVTFIKQKVGKLSKEEQRTVFIASSRMSITNPYFMGRSVHSINAGGTLEHLKFRSFEDLKIADHIGYHYACIAFALLNGGYMCFNSHMGKLEELGQEPEAIDQALRLATVIASIRQNIFNSNFL